jgi:hypothetical protein
VEPFLSLPTWSSENRVLVTVGLGPGFENPVRRMTDQATAIGWFHGVTGITDKASPAWMAEYMELTAELRASNLKGYGLWSWKPFCVMQTLLTLDEGGHLYYMDAGCELSAFGEGRMKAIDRNVAEHGAAFFELPFIERDWTKPSLLRRYDSSLGESPQIQATWFGLKNCAATRELVRSWWEACSSEDFWALREEAGFRHRHDQSVLSCIVKSKRQDFSVRPWEDLFAPWLYVKDSWVLLEPVHALRKRGAKTIVTRLVGESSLRACEENLRRPSLEFKARNSVRRVVSKVRDELIFARQRLG